MMGAESTTIVPESTQTTTTKPPSTTKSVSIAFGMIFMILLLIVLAFLYRKCKSKLTQSNSTKAPPQGATAVDVVTFVNDLVSGRKEQSGTTKTQMTVENGEKPSRPDLPCSKIKISSLEPQRQEVSKWDD